MDSLKRIIIPLLAVVMLVMMVLPFAQPVMAVKPPSCSLNIQTDPSTNAYVYIWDTTTSSWISNGAYQESLNIDVPCGHCYTVWVAKSGYLYKVKNLTGAGSSGWCCIGAPVASGCIDNNQGCNIHFSSKVIAANNPPVADANGPYTGCAGVAITLDGSGSSDPDSGDTLEYRWDFEYDSVTPSFDTGWLSVPTTTHAYASAGTYTVLLEVRDLFGGTPVGGTDTDTATVTVYAKPTATPTSNSPVCEGSTIELYGDAGMASWSWSGPGGWTSTLQNPTRSGATLAMAGTYTLTVTNGNSCQDTETTNVAVNAKPTADFSADSTEVCVGTPVQFTECVLVRRYSLLMALVERRAGAGHLLEAVRPVPRGQGLTQ